MAIMFLTSSLSPLLTLLLFLSVILLKEFSTTTILEQGEYCGKDFLQQTVGISLIPGYLIQFIQVTEESKTSLLILLYNHTLIIDSKNPQINLNKHNIRHSISLGQLIYNLNVGSKIEENLINWPAAEKKTEENIGRINIAWNRPMPNINEENFRASLYASKTYDNIHYQNVIYINESVNHSSISFFMNNLHNQTNIFYLASIQYTMILKYHLNDNSLSLYYFENFSQKFNGFLRFDPYTMTVSLSSRFISVGFTEEFMLKYDYDYGFHLYDDHDPTNNYWRIFLVSNREKSVITFNRIAIEYYDRIYPFKFLTFDDIFHCSESSQEKEMAIRTESLPPSSNLNLLEMKIWEPHRFLIFIIGMVIISIMFIMIIFIVICMRTRRLSPIRMNDDTDSMFMDISNGYDSATTAATIRSPLIFNRNVQKNRNRPVYERWQQQQYFQKIGF